MNAPPVDSRQLLKDFAQARATFRQRDVPEELHHHYWLQRWFGSMAHPQAMTHVFRLSSVARRWRQDAKRCDRCSTRLNEVRVLWRSEAGRPVSINHNGTLHACL